MTVNKLIQKQKNCCFAFVCFLSKNAHSKWHTLATKTCFCRSTSGLNHVWQKRVNPAETTRPGGITVRTLDAGSKGCEFDSRSGRHQVVTTWTGDCLRTGKPSQYITNHQGQLSHLYLRGRQTEYSPACLAGVKTGHVHLRWVAGNTM